jgi:hypothetical protein
MSGDHEPPPRHHIAVANLHQGSFDNHQSMMPGAATAGHYYNDEGNGGDRQQRAYSNNIESSNVNYNNSHNNNININPGNNGGISTGQQQHYSGVSVDGQQRREEGEEGTGPKVMTEQPRRDSGMRKINARTLIV